MISLNLRVNISILSIDIYYFNSNESFLITVLPLVENTAFRDRFSHSCDSVHSLLMLIFLLNTSH